MASIHANAANNRGFESQRSNDGVAEQDCQGLKYWIFLHFLINLLIKHACIAYEMLYEL